MTLTVWTVGHSTRPLPDFLAILAAYRIERSPMSGAFPVPAASRNINSRHSPPRSTRAGIGYIWLPDLGGRRQPASEAPQHRLAAPGIPRLRRPSGR